MVALFWDLVVGIMLATSFAVIFPGLFANQNAVQIDANGSLDTNKEYWHKMNAFIRFMVSFTVGVLAVEEVFFLAPRCSWQAISWLSLYGLFSIALFWLLFDRRLNRVRDLPDNYIGENSTLDILLADEESRIIRNKLVLVAVTGILYMICTVWLLVSVYHYGLR